MNTQVTQSHDNFEALRRENASSFFWLAGILTTLLAIFTFFSWIIIPETPWVLVTIGFLLASGSVIRWHKRFGNWISS